MDIGSWEYYLRNFVKAGDCQHVFLCTHSMFLDMFLGAKSKFKVLLKHCMLGCATEEKLHQATFTQNHREALYACMYPMEHKQMAGGRAARFFCCSYRSFPR